MAITFYDLCGKNQKRFSPFGWRTRMALAHKGLDYSLELVKFTEKQKLEFSGQSLVPVIKDGETVVNDSWAIAEYLEDTYPDRPSLFGSTEGRGMAKVIDNFVTRTIQPMIPSLIIADLAANVDSGCLEYFVSSREKRFGKPLTEVQAGREGRVEAALKAMEPIRAVIKDQPFIGGETPTYADFPLFAVLQWARCGSPFQIVPADDPIHAWFDRLLDAYHGVGRSEPAAA
ncbi:MAG: glutathione S-transferase family protein [Alphaproteobacteria bacterium]|nr:glutathione S-transferase family protein [Alphaproteobacteria bacterium]